MLKPARQPIGYGLSRYNGGNLHIAPPGGMGVLTEAQRADYGQAGEPAGRDLVLAATTMTGSLAVTHAFQQQQQNLQQNYSHAHQKKSQQMQLQQQYHTPTRRISMGTIPSMPSRDRNARLRYNLNRYQRKRQKQSPSHPELSITQSRSLSSAAGSAAVTTVATSPEAKSQHYHPLHSRIRNGDSVRASGSTSTRRQFPSQQRSVAHFADRSGSGRISQRRPRTAQTPRSMQRFGGGFQSRPKTASRQHQRHRPSRISKSVGGGRRQRSRRRFHVEERTSESLVPETSSVMVPTLSPRPPPGVSTANAARESSVPTSPRSPRRKNIVFGKIDHQRGHSIRMQRRGWSKPQRTPTFIRTTAYSQYGFGDARAFLPVRLPRRPGRGRGQAGGGGRQAGAGGYDHANEYVLSPRGASMPPTVTIPTASMKLTDMESALGGAIVVPEPQVLLPLESKLSSSMAEVKENTVKENNTISRALNERIALIASAQVTSIVNSAFTRVVRATL